MGKKNDNGGSGIVGYVLIILLLAFFVDYVGMFNVPYIHQIDEKYVHPKLDPVLSPYLSKIGLVPAFPTTLDAINNAGVDTKHSVVGGHFQSSINGDKATLNGVVRLSSALIDGTRVGVAEIVTIKLVPPSTALKMKLGSSYDAYASLYNETGGTIIVIFYNDDVQYTGASAGGSLSFGNTSIKFGVSGLAIRDAQLKLAKSEGYQYYLKLGEFAGKVPLSYTAQVVVFDRAGNKWLKMGTVQSTVVPAY